MKSYKELHTAYIASATWAARRNAYYATHARCCAVCGKTGTRDNPIQLHHATYKRVGNERDGDLFPLCANHHRQVHRLYKRSDDLTLRQATQKVISAKRKKKRKAAKRDSRARRYGAMKKPPANLSPYGDDGRTAA